MTTIIAYIVIVVTEYASILNLRLNPLARLRQEVADLRRERDTLHHQIGGHLRDALRAGNANAHLRRRVTTLACAYYQQQGGGVARVTRKVRVPL